jgi:hypothetical protein
MVTTEESRPAIPAELKRQVLVEAGHRCAIHTCRHPADVDIHHIIPWAQCREHTFENLIALCPNCHRRADAGEIDRKSLTMYKARLAAPFYADSDEGHAHVDKGDVYPDENPNAPSYAWLDPGRRWRTVTQQESDLKRHFEARLEYPQFEGKNFDALNDFIREKMLGTLKRFQEDYVYGPDADDGEHLMAIHFAINSSFAIALLHPNLISARFSIYRFAGGAHGSMQSETLNAILDPFTPLRLSSIFPDLRKGAADLSNYCIKSLLDSQLPYGAARDENWVKTGAGPKPSNFAKFNLTKQGLLVTFDEYQIDCYAAGPSEVLVPYGVFGNNFDSRIRSELFRI